MRRRRRVLLVVSDARDADGLPEDLVRPADRYVEGGERASDPRTFVVNLCRSFRYGSRGYYVSLLADARGQEVVPTLETCAGLTEPYTRFRALQEAGIATLDAAEMAVRRRALRGRASAAPPAVAPGALDTTSPASTAAPSPVPPSVAPAHEEPARFAFPRPIVRVAGPDAAPAYRPARDDEVAEALVCLGHCADARFRQAARVVFREWPAPLLRLQFMLEDGAWIIAQVAAAAPHQLGDEERGLFVEVFGDRERILRRGRAAERETVRASLAVLVDASDPYSPSTPETIDRLERVAARQNVHVARLGLADLRKLPEYDALFVRSFTAVTHPAFQFALRAEALGMPVIDDTQSTTRCTNKVFLEELLRREGVPTPHTRIVTEHTPWEEIAVLGMPFVIKLPDASFSAGMHKITSAAEYGARARAMFRKSPLLIAQEWLPTDFDWRIAVLGGNLLFAAKYYMARGHWQIRSVEHGAERFGRVEAVPRERAPADVVAAALRATRLIGDGFYGVDLKETARGPVVIEVNDNPNLDAGYDDTADGDRIYDDIVRYFLERLESVSADEAPPARAERTRRPGRAHASLGTGRQYGLFEVAGLELEYPTVDAGLNVVPLVERAFRVLAGRGTSDVELGAVAFSNEFADHVFEIKTLEPPHSLAAAEEALCEGLERFGTALRDEFDARLLPTGMHPWFDPVDARLWTRSGLRLYTTYARLFDVRTHGWMNVHASHVNLPFGNERETIAMHTAASLLLPYLPALAASSPMHDGRLQDSVDARLEWLAVLQARVPESCGAIVPEYVDSFADYRRRILNPMYAALDRLPGAGALRHEFFNARGAVLRFGRRALELRVLDTQESVKLDVAIAAFVRAALRELTARLLAGELTPPPHAVLVTDFQACARAGSAARVAAPHCDAPRGADGECAVRDVLRGVLARARAAARADEGAYLDLVADIIEQGTLAERIRAALAPHAGDETSFREAVRRLYGELADCLETNRVWSGRAQPWHANAERAAGYGVRAGSHA